MAEEADTRRGSQFPRQFLARFFKESLIVAIFSRISVFVCIHTYEWVMSHVWMCHTTHVNASCYKYMDVSCHTDGWVMSYLWIIHVTLTNASCHMPYVCMRHVTHVKASSWAESCVHIYMSIHSFMCIHIYIQSFICMYTVYVHRIVVYTNAWVSVSVSTCVSVSTSANTYHSVVSHVRVHHYITHVNAGLCLYIYKWVCVYMYIYKYTSMSHVTQTGASHHRRHVTHMNAGLCLHIYKWVWTYTYINKHTSTSSVTHTSASSRHTYECKIMCSYKQASVCIYVHL